jgi:hypothetical protein
MAPSYPSDNALLTVSRSKVPKPIGASASAAVAVCGPWLSVFSFTSIFLCHLLCSRASVKYSLSLRSSPLVVSVPQIIHNLDFSLGRDSHCLHHFNLYVFHNWPLSSSGAAHLPMGDLSFPYYQYVYTLFSEAPIPVSAR